MEDVFYMFIYQMIKSEHGGSTQGYLSSALVVLHCLKLTAETFFIHNFA